jgi:hypothetical protein
MGVLSQVVEVGRWLEGFHLDSHVELDYAGLGEVVGVTLGGDDAAEDLASAVADLVSGALEAGTAVFRRVAGTFRGTQLYQRAN